MATKKTTSTTTVVDALHGGRVSLHDGGSRTSIQLEAFVPGESDAFGCSSGQCAVIELNRKEAHELWTAIGEWLGDLTL